MVTALRITLAATVVLGLSWHAALVVHELGHVLHAYFTSGRAVHVDLHPLRFSSTDVEPNPHPLIVVLGGPLWGCLIPLALHAAATLKARRCSALGAVARVGQPSVADLSRFFAAFCLILNGSYIGLGWIDRAGDAGDLIRMGVSAWLLTILGVLTLGGGLWLLHSMGPRVGLPRLASVSWVSVGVLAAIWATMLSVEAGLGTWTPPPPIP